MSGNDQKILVLLLGLTIIRGIIYISIFPPWLAPDEPAHFEAIRLLGQVDAWPDRLTYQASPMHPDMKASFDEFRVWQISRHVPPSGDNSQTFIQYYPPTSTASIVSTERYSILYHLLLAPVSKISTSFDIVTQVYLLRLVSLVIVVLTVGIGWSTVRRLFAGSLVYPAAVAAFLAFLPMHLHVNTSINTDAPATLLVFLFWWALLRIFFDGPSFWRTALVATIFVLAIIIKPTTIYIIPTLMAAVIIFLARRFHWKWPVSTVLLAGLIVTTFFGAIFLFQLTSTGRVLSLTPADLSRLNLDVFNVTQEHLYTYAIALHWSFLSFWGLFGWANLHIPFAWLWWLGAFVVLSGIGVAIFVWRHILNPSSSDLRFSAPQRDMLLALLFGAIFAMIQLYVPVLATQSLRWGPPARYIFPALLPLSLYLFLGYRQMIPARFRQFALPVWVSALIAYDSVTFLLVVLPSIYG
ncbi:MAG: DUF2142 domain-containing protein [Chloroflexi bacterium]|nr:MAG: DUF2142 domain-containing protein [Chloroflexota bacterium]